jgi:hypothetical protein
MGVGNLYPFDNCKPSIDSYDRFENVYGFGIGPTGLTYLGQAVGSIAGLGIVLYVYDYYWAKESMKAKEIDSSANMLPEKRRLVLTPISLQQETC